MTRERDGEGLISQVTLPSAHVHNTNVTNTFYLLVRVFSDLFFMSSSKKRKKVVLFCGHVVFYSSCHVLNEVSIIFFILVLYQSLKFWYYDNLNSPLCSFGQYKQTDTSSYCFALFIFDGPCHLSS